MRNALFFALSICDAALMLALDIWPGLLGYFWPIGLGGWLVLIGVLSWWDRLKEQPLTVSRYRLAAVGGFVITAILLGLHVPQRVAFMLFEPQFEAAADNPPLCPPWIGPYPIEEIGDDGNGGVHFLTWRSLLGSGHFKECGFVRRPNGARPPFGRSSRRLVHLVGAWHSFEGLNP